jgi:hypothetical protein
VPGEGVAGGDAQKQGREGETHGGYKSEDNFRCYICDGGYRSAAKDLREIGLESRGKHRTIHGGLSTVTAAVEERRSQELGTNKERVSS